MKKYFFHKTPKGFTLVELLVVIAIIGILSSVVLASLGGARGKARDAKRVAELKGAQAAIELYFDACGEYPATFALTTKNGCSTGVEFSTFLPIIPIDPKTGDSYTYYAYNTSTTNTYVLKGVLESANSALESDVDGTVTVNGNAVNCGDDIFAFCLVP